MKTILFYLLLIIGISISMFGIYATYKDLKTTWTYNKAQEDNPDKVIISPYNTTMADYNKTIWKSLVLWAIFTFIGWMIIYYSDKFINKGNWINDEFAPIIVIAIFAIPVYYFFSSIN